jgi:hypothetical protein
MPRLTKSKVPTPALKECNSCWYVVHGTQRPYQSQFYCGITYTNPKVAAVCPCLNCITKMMCKEACKKRKRLVMSNY